MKGDFIMMLYNLQELVQLAKEDLGIRELPPAVTDKDLYERVKRSALKEISVVYPRIEEFNIGEPDMVDPSETYSNKYNGVRYRVPKWITHQFTPMAVISVDNISQNGFADIMWPYGTGFAAPDVISSVAGIKGAAAVGQNIAHAVSFNFDSMTNIITIYNGWISGTYRVRMTVSHDENLSTIPPTAMLTVRELIMYDVGQYIYNTLKRKDKLDTPAGNIDLRIDDLADCGNKKKELLEKLEEDCSLDFEEMDWF